MADPSTQEMLGATEWLLYTENPFPEGPQRVEADWWPEGEHREFATELVNQLYAPRMNWCRRPFAGTLPFPFSPIPFLALARWYFEDGGRTVGVF